MFSLLNGLKLSCLFSVIFGPFQLFSDLLKALIWNILNLSRTMFNFSALEMNVFVLLLIKCCLERFLEPCCLNFVKDLLNLICILFQMPDSLYLIKSRCWDGALGLSKSCTCGLFKNSIQVWIWKDFNLNRIYVAFQKHMLHKSNHCCSIFALQNCCNMQFT